MNNKELLEAAKKAIDDLFADKSVSIEQCIENLEELHSEIESLLDCLNPNNY